MWSSKTNISIMSMSKSCSIVLPHSPLLFLHITAYSHRIYFTAQLTPRVTTSNMFSKLVESLGRKLPRWADISTKTKPKENDDILLTVIGPGRQCEVCYNIRDVEDFTAKDACKHLKVTCRFCIKGYLDMRTENCQVFSFNCWECGYELDHTALKDLIPAKDFQASVQCRPFRRPYH